MVTDSISGTRKKHRQILAVQIISQFFYAAGSIILKGYSSTAQNAVAVLRNRLFLMNLDSVLKDDYLIGAALQPWCASFLPGAIAAIDMVELMCYDNWDDEGFHSTMELAKQDVKNMLKLGYKLNQIDLGLPFYARPTTKEARWYDYRAYWDKIDENGLAVEEGTGLIASFNTPQLIYEKTQWAIETGLAGVMIWHYHCDVPADNDASLFNAITRARTDLAAQTNG